MIISQESPANPTTPTSIDPADAARLLASLPLRQLPRMSWTITEVGGIVCHPPPHAKPAEHRAAFTAWASHFGLIPDPEHRSVKVHLRAQGVVSGVLVTVWSVHCPERLAVYDR